MSQEEILKIITIFADSIESAAICLKQQIAKMQVEAEPHAVVSEETFAILSFESQKGTKIGNYEVAYKSQNLPDKWNHAFNILRKANATISSRYHGEGYRYSYWLYGLGKIYRQLLKLNSRPKE